MTMTRLFDGRRAIALAAVAGLLLGGGLGAAAASTGGGDTPPVASTPTTSTAPPATSTTAPVVDAELALNTAAGGSLVYLRIGIAWGTGYAGARSIARSMGPLDDEQLLVLCETPAGDTERSRLAQEIFDGACIAGARLAGGGDDTPGLLEWLTEERLDDISRLIALTIEEETRG